MTMTLTDFLTILPRAFVACLGGAPAAGRPVDPARTAKGSRPCWQRSGWRSALGLTLAQTGRDLPPAFNGMVVLDGFAVFAEHDLPGQRPGGIALAYELPQAHGPRTRRILPADALLHRRHDADGPGLRPDHRLPGAGTALDPALYSGRFWPARSPNSEESALKYFLLGTFSSAFVLYGIAMIFGATARTDLQGIVAAVAVGSRSTRCCFMIGAALAAGGLGLQSVGGALPHVDAGCLPGRALAGHRLYVGERQGGRVRRAAARVCDGFPQPGGDPVAGPGGAGCADHDRRQRARRSSKPTSSACWPIPASPTSATC